LLATVNRSSTHGNYPHPNKPYGYEERERASRGRAHSILPTWQMVLPTTPPMSRPLTVSTGVTVRGLPSSEACENHRNKLQRILAAIRAVHARRCPSHGQHAFECKRWRQRNRGCGFKENVTDELSNRHVAENKVGPSAFASSTPPHQRSLRLIAQRIRCPPPPPPGHGATNHTPGMCREARADNMVRKHRTKGSAGESSGSHETADNSARAEPQWPSDRGHPPQQQGGAAGRGWAPSSSQQTQQGGRGGRRYYQSRSGRPQPHDAQQPGAPSEYQGRGSSQPRGGMPPQQQSGGRRGGRGVAGGCGSGPSAAGPSRPPAPELHQATKSPYQATQAAPLKPSSSQQPEFSATEVAEQFQQLSVHREASSQAIQPMPASSSKSMRFPMRPGKGTFGIKCVVKANHFVAELSDKDLHQYTVSIMPESISRGVNRALMEHLVKLYREAYLGGRLPVYDGRNSLYTAGPLPFTSREFHISLDNEDDGSGMGRRCRVFRVVIKLAARVNLHHLEMFLAGRQADAPQDALQVLDIVLRELPTARYVPVGRSFYSPDIGIRKTLGEGLESWRGFYQSIRPTQMGLSLNIDMSSTAFIEPLPVIDFVARLLNRDVQSRPLYDADHVKIKKALRGVKVEVTHRGNMRRKYRISGLTSQATRELT
ncbi:hypothetical protein BHE74_00032042, partial [Ensete ventricosum]